MEGGWVGTCTKMVSPGHFLLLQALGQVGLVLRNVVSGSVLVRVNRKRWIFNPLSLIPVPDSELPNNFGELSIIIIITLVYM